MLFSLNKFFEKKCREAKGGYAVLIVGVLFAVGMVVVSTQIAKQTLNYQRAVGDSLEENIQERYVDNMGNRILSRLMNFGSGYYEIGNRLDFSKNGSLIRDQLELPQSSFNDGNKDIQVEYDFFGASVVPVPTAYSFDAQSGRNNLMNARVVDPDVNHGQVGESGPADLKFYTGDNGVECDPSSNYGGAEDYNIFKRANDGKNFAAVSLPNYQCGKVGLRVERLQDSYRSGEQLVVTNERSEREANYYYTVPALGTGDAGIDCSPHKVNFDARWNNSDEYIDPLDHPCNWNVMEKGETIKFGLSSYTLSDIREKTAGNVGGKVESLALTGSNLEEDVQKVFEHSYYEGLDKNDVLVLRIRLRCTDGTSYCHPVERYEFYDSEFLNEFDNTEHDECIDENGQQICSHTYSALAKHHIESPEFDFSRLVMGYGVADSGRFLPMRGDYNLAQARQDRLDFIKEPVYGYNSNILISKSRNNSFSMISSNVLRGNFQKELDLELQTKFSRTALQYNNKSDYQFGYDNQNKVSNILVNKLEVPYDEQGFQYDYDSEYFHLYLLDTDGKDDLKNPEFVLQALDDFVEIINRKNVNADPRTYTKLEYQIVSDQIIGMDEGYMVYDFGYGTRINKNKYKTSGIVENGFVNVSN